MQNFRFVCVRDGCPKGVVSQGIFSTCRETEMDSADANKSGLNSSMRFLDGCDTLFHRSFKVVQRIEHSYSLVQVLGMVWINIRNSLKVCLSLRAKK